MLRERNAIHSEEELSKWYRPPQDTVAEKYRARYNARCAALHAVLIGETNLSAAAKDHSLCRKRLRSMIERALRLAPDGQPYGFRVCVPWGGYCKAETSIEVSMPTRAVPHAIATLLLAQPQIGTWVGAYSRPLPPGRAPRSFIRLHDKIVKELKRLDLHAYYPLNQPDKGKRALLRYIRTRRIETAPMPGMDELDAVQPTALAEIFRGHPFDRMELDGHRIDIEAAMQIKMPKGGLATRNLTALWFLAEVECESRAITSWTLRVGRNYNSLDVTECIASSLQSWVPRDLTIPNLAYAPGAGMPSGLPPPIQFRRGRMLALDNHKAHHAHDVEQAFCRAHDGILTFGLPHQPRTRPIIEQLFSRLEKGAFRDIAGGFEPATKLGEHKLRISNFAPEDHPIQLHLLEELLDVIVANYNATPHPALGNMSPLQYLQQRSHERHWFYEPSDADACAVDMSSVLVPVKVLGNRKTGVMPHINYAYVRYRSPELDNSWELIGKTLTARVLRQDLRTIALYRTATQPVGILRATGPWSHTRHDETTRKLIYQWSRQPGGLSLAGADCAVSAYINFLRQSAKQSQQAVDQLARIQQQHPTMPVPPARHSLMDTPIRAPRRGWVSLDKMRDA
ncbi:hypothetical protein EAH75_04860 [Rhodanobacter glycinis]|uniref:hypothetical protein n=1 Tax=Rhodanobacter glycinis TaxID=582702 RepID=UPI001126DEEA|nr:hypothetical protein [Rhodanobacter glycinis]TPG50763.1 hypothetical protein EAH75_04860 [Rhodanobacter glycinis]